MVNRVQAREKRSGSFSIENNFSIEIGLCNNVLSFPAQCIMKSTKGNYWKKCVFERTVFK